MGKQTENNKNKTSKKNYSFTGHRVIGENKSKHLSENSDGDTTDMMKNILDSDTNVNHNSIGSVLGASMNNSMMNQGFNNQMVPVDQPFMMQPNMMQPNMMGQQNNKLNFMGDVDPYMVNTLAPINPNHMNGLPGMENLMSSSQMAQGLKSIANLNKLENIGASNIQLSDVAPSGMSQMMMPQMNGMNQLNAMNQMMPQMNGMNQLNAMNQMGMPPTNMNVNSIKNLIGLNNVPMV